MNIDFQRLAPYLLFACFVIYIPLGGALLYNPGVDGFHDAYGYGVFIAYLRQALAMVAILCLVLDPEARIAVLKAWPVWPLLTIILMSQTWSFDPKQSGYACLDATVALFFMPAICRWAGPERASRTLAMINGWIVAGSVATVILLPRRGVVQPYDLQGTDHVGAWRGMFVHKNIMGEIATVAGIYLISTFLRSPKSERPMWGAFILCAIACLLFSHSSNALLAFVIGLAAYGGLMSKPLSHPVPLLICFALGALLASGLSIGMDTLASMIGRDTTFSGRAGIWALALEMISQNLLLGHGYGTVDTVFRAISQRDLFSDAVDTHEAYLDVTFDIGVLGMGCLLFPVGYNLVRGYIAVRRTDGEERSRYASYMGVLFAVMVMATAEVSPFRVSGHGATSFYIAVAAIGQLPMPSGQTVAAAGKTFVGRALRIAKPRGAQIGEQY